MEYLRTIDNSATMIAGASGVTQQGVDISKIFSVCTPTINTAFPNTGIANQLKQVAKIMKLNQTPPGLGLVRQVFFVSQGGYDTHQDQLNDQGNNFTDLSAAMNAFYMATLELGLQNSVTTFTMSDFGRTLQPSGSGGGIGSDHAWGNHQFVMGAAVLPVLRPGQSPTPAPSSRSTSSAAPTTPRRAPTDAAASFRRPPSRSTASRWPSGSA